MNQKKITLVIEPTDLEIVVDLVNREYKAFRDLAFRTTDEHADMLKIIYVHLNTYLDQYYEKNEKSLQKFMIKL